MLTGGQPQANKNSFVRNSLIASRSFAAFSNSSCFAASQSRFQACQLAACVFHSSATPAFPLARIKSSSRVASGNPFTFAKSR